VTQLEKRVKEASRLGFVRAIVPAGNVGKVKVSGIKTIGVQTVYKAIESALGEHKQPA
jgi:DNA repair protein RadA/Sms